MNNFTYDNKTKVIFGKSTEDCVGSETKKYSDKVLLHYGGGSIKKTGLYDRVLKSLKEADVEVIELGGVSPNPRLTLVNEGIKICKENNIGFILAVGGGSVIDSAKAIGVGVCYEGDVWDFYEYKASPKKTLPLGVILTIPAAGSETSPGSVITNQAKKLKRGMGAICMRPEFCILNPELTFTLPDYQTACGAADMLAHVMERYFVATKNVDLTDRLCEATMKSIILQAKKLVINPNDYEARAEIMLSGTIAHNDSLDVGRGGDWASHEMEHELSAMNDIAHGAGLAIIFPAWMKHVYKENPDKFVQFFTRVFNIDENHENREETILLGIKALEEFYKELGLPTRLSDVDFDNSLIPEMATKAVKGGTLGNFKTLTSVDTEKIYNLAK
ncbi:MAG: iron-containing alcohol dehydrogenase [Spirochaetaceae bacterium]